MGGDGGFAVRQGIYHAQQEARLTTIAAEIAYKLEPLCAADRATVRQKVQELLRCRDKEGV